MQFTKLFLLKILEKKNMIKKFVKPLSNLHPNILVLSLILLSSPKEQGQNWPWNMKVGAELTKKLYGWESNPLPWLELCKWPHYKVKTETFPLQYNYITKKTYQIIFSRISIHFSLLEVIPNVPWKLCNWFF